jgi:ABC-type histidine transport system ATPase subunit
MDNAAIIEDGTPEHIFDSPDSPRLASFLKAVL